MSSPFPPGTPDGLHPSSLRGRDEEWVARIRAGDASAFETVFRTYYSGLRGFIARYVRSYETAEELVQELFLRLWTQRERWVIEESLQTYLYRAARNHALNHLKH